MTAIVVPFRGADGKRRLEPARDEARAALALAMLADVLAACAAVGRTIVVTGDEAARAVAIEVGVAALDDPGGGQGPAVAHALDLVPVAPALVVNADLPCVVPDDLRALEAAIPVGGLALAPAADGTTNAIGLDDPRLFRPLYGPGSAARFGALAPATTVEVPNLVDDVDTLDDLARLEGRVGPRTQMALAMAGLVPAT
jgi:2-phospho-L-lactate/phosphoenolpyruvate guanylyltransferase